MSRTLSYADAVRVLGGPAHPAVNALDRLTGGLLLAASATGAGWPLSLFDAKAELAKLSGRLITDLDHRLAGLSRFGRTEALAAAHAVIVVAAYFDGLARVRLPFEVGELDLDKADQVRLATGDSPGTPTLATLADALLRTSVPMPVPQVPYEVTLDRIGDLYRRMSDAVFRFTLGLAVWDRIDDAERRQFEDQVRGDVPLLAVGQYEEMLRRLAVDCPEVAFWANAVDHQATRLEIGRLRSGLAGLERILTELAGGRNPGHRRAALSAAHRAVLERPIIEPGDVSDGLQIPTLAAAYVNPDFRVAQVDSADRIAEEAWWNARTLRRDLQGFLFGHLTAPQAVEAPLLVLGQPGSGKSVLTRVLAARLPASDFLVVRVVLRDAPADADLQAQIEYGVRAATGERLSWSEMAGDAGDALPVVLLDGFDELLQTTGASQSDYLEQVSEFQRREAALGRPVAIMVTSRTAVAHRARAAPGMVALRLEPFQLVHIKRWLEVWNGANASFFAQRQLRPLSSSSLARHAELASQPLLLLMLALYDADDNALQREDENLDQAQLYERLLTRFAAREVAKTGASLPADRFDEHVERELLRLSLVAFAMFNRSRQWVTEAELNADLAALLPEPTSSATFGMRAPLTAADVVLGRFFFVHDAQASRDGAMLRTYEFLHATFGEYLIARFVARELTALARLAELVTGHGRPAQPDDAFLHALLSFSPLTVRGTAVSFLGELIARLPHELRNVLHGLLLSLFRVSLQARRETMFNNYEPAQRSVPARHAAYAANLLLLAVLAGGQVTGSEMFSVDDVVKPWRDLALLWRSQLSSEGFTGLVYALNVERAWNDSRREIRLTIPKDDIPAPATDLYWTALITPEHGVRGNSIWGHSSADFLWRVRHFTCDFGDDLPAAALETLRRRCGMAISTIHGLWPDRAVSAADALIALLIARVEANNPDEVIAAYETCLRIALHNEPFLQDAAAATAYRDLLFRQLAFDRPRLPVEWLDSVRVRIVDAGLDVGWLNWDTL